MATCLDLENLLLSERVRKRNTACHLSVQYKAKCIEIESRMVVVRDWLGESENDQNLLTSSYKSDKFWGI